MAVWREEFLWSAMSFMVAGRRRRDRGVVIARGEHWKGVLSLAPVSYLTYQTYRVFIARLEDQKRHLAEMTRLEGARRQALEREQRGAGGSGGGIG